MNIEPGEIYIFGRNDFHNTYGLALDEENTFREILSTQNTNDPVEGQPCFLHLELRDHPPPKRYILRRTEASGTETIIEYRSIKKFSLLPSYPIRAMSYDRFRPGLEYQIKLPFNCVLRATLERIHKRQLTTPFTPPFTRKSLFVLVFRDPVIEHDSFENPRLLFFNVDGRPKFIMSTFEFSLFIPDSQLQNIQAYLETFPISQEDHLVHEQGFPLKIINPDTRNGLIHYKSSKVLSIRSLYQLQHHKEKHLFDGTLSARLERAPTYHKLVHDKRFDEPDSKAASKSSVETEMKESIPYDFDRRRHEHGEHAFAEIKSTRASSKKEAMPVEIYRPGERILSSLSAKEAASQIPSHLIDDKIFGALRAKKPTRSLKNIDGEDLYGGRMKQNKRSKQTRSSRWKRRTRSRV